MTVSLKCIDRTAGTAVYRDLISRGAPATVGDYTDGCRVTLPSDQPGFLFSIIEAALEAGHITDDAGAECIRDMERTLGREA